MSNKKTSRGRSQKSWLDSEFGKQIGIGGRMLLEGLAEKFLGKEVPHSEEAEEAKRKFDEMMGRWTGKTQDPYQTLGLDRDADDEVVKAAYRSLSRKYHPDSGKSPNADKMKQINSAWEAIKKERGL